MRNIVHFAIFDIEAVRRNSLSTVGKDIFHECSVVSKELGVSLEPGCELIPALHRNVLIIGKRDLV